MSEVIQIKHKEHVMQNGCEEIFTDQPYRQIIQIIDVPTTPYLFGLASDGSLWRAFVHSDGVVDKWKISNNGELPE